MNMISCRKGILEWKIKWFSHFELWVSKSQRPKVREQNNLKRKMSFPHLPSFSSPSISLLFYIKSSLIFMPKKTSPSQMSKLSHSLDLKSQKCEPKNECTNVPWFLSKKGSQNEEIWIKKKDTKTSKDVQGKKGSSEIASRRLTSFCDSRKIRKRKKKEKWKGEGEKSWKRERKTKWGIKEVANTKRRLWM